MKHWFAKHAGEVASAQALDYLQLGQEVPTRLLHPQMAITGLQRQQFDKENHHQAAAGAVVPLQDATRLGNTTFVEYRGGAWVFKKHRLISLPELVWDWKETHTATEIYFWYMHAKKVIKKRSHPKGSQDRRDAAKLRHREQGRWGFPR